RKDVVAGDLRHLFLAVADVEVTLIVELADIPGVQPAVAQYLGGRLRQVAVVAHDLRSSHADLAFLADAEHAGRFVGIDDLHLGARKRHADRSGLASTAYRV